MVDAFAVRYARKFLELPGAMSTHEACKKYDAKQRLKVVKSLPAAIKYVRLNATLMGSHTSTTSGNIIYDAFRYTLCQAACGQKLFNGARQGVMRSSPLVC